MGITNGIWGFTSIINGILQITTYASVQSQLSSHQGQLDSLQAQCNTLQSEITGDEGAISRLENLTQNINSTSTVAGSTNLNGNVIMNAGELFLEYTSINPITLLSTPNIVVSLSYRNEGS